MKTILIRKTDRNKVSISFINNHTIYVVFRNGISNTELEVDSNFDLINAHKFTDKYNYFKNCKVIDVTNYKENYIDSKIQQVKCTFESINTVTESDILARIRKEKLININGTI